MLKSETAQLLAKAALIDNRTIDTQTVEAWHETIGDLHYPEALTALTIHRRESTDYLQPAHIRTNIRKARETIATEHNRARALEATPNTTRGKPPAWFREFLNNLGKEPAQADLSHQKDAA